eukprot:jgi/Hompol1/6492/HPOL_000782-RA
MPWFTSTPKPSFSIYDLPQPLNPPESIINRTAPPIPESAGVDVNDPLAVAIWYHEQNHLAIAAYYFSLSAAKGNPLGLFLFAISKRHGWGMKREEEEAVRLLQVAANQATGEFAKQAASLRRLGKRYSLTATPQSLSIAAGPAGPTSAGENTSTVSNVGRPDQAGDQDDAHALGADHKLVHPNRHTLQTARKHTEPAPPSLSELLLAIYELAMSFKQGWGVPQNKITAVYYLSMAAELGDADAQVELAECYLRGDGIKPNKMMAAHWFRKAEKQGVRLVQMQWIWKEKYDNPALDDE